MGIKMRPKKEFLPWPEDYESPKIFNINTAFQQALGATLCSPLGSGASRGAGGCSAGASAIGNPGEPNACLAGSKAMVGPGKGTSPCGPGLTACAQG